MGLLLGAIKAEQQKQSSGAALQSGIAELKPRSPSFGDGAIEPVLRRQRWGNESGVTEAGYAAGVAELGLQSQGHRVRAKISKSTCRGSETEAQEARGH